MSFLRRILRGGAGEDAEREAGTGGERGGRAGVEPRGGQPIAEPNDVALDEAERTLERELALEEDARLDELQRRQLRYADHAWKPPPEGGARRADDAPAGDTGPTDTD